jgi:two-component system response regulator AlgR
MVLKVLIVDDEALARARLRTLLGDCTAPAASVQAEAANAAQAVEWLQHHDADLALVDIHMPGADGLALAQMLRTLPHPPAVVFVTAHAEHAVQAFELEALDYLTKPVRLERLQAMLQKVERLAHANRAPEPDLPQEILVIQDRGSTVRVPLAQVLYFKAELKYVTVRTRDKSFILDASLSELEDKYKDHFMRIHRNALISRRAVRALVKHHDPQEGEGWAVRLEGIDELLFVSRRQLAAVREVVAGVG